jgi:cellulose biosynthesis protein BcsQ
MRTIAFFNNKGGVGKTTLVYHLAWMYSEMDVRVLVVDLDPQANATAMFMHEDQLEAIYETSEGATTVYRAFKPLLDVGDIAPVHIWQVTEELGLAPGDLALSEVEEALSSNWLSCLGDEKRAFRVISAIRRMIEKAAKDHEAEVVLLDVGPNLGALNRSALISADYVVVPLAPDLYSLQGLRNLGPTLRKWRTEWQTRLDHAKSIGVDFSLPSGKMLPIGYVVLQHAVRADRPVKAYNRWMDRIPQTYAQAVMNDLQAASTSVDRDPNCLAMLKNFRSLMPMAQEAHKPMFLLRAADGAIGGHAQAVQACYGDFAQLVAYIEEATVGRPE